MTQQVRRMAVLGGGITGLSAAFYLMKYAAERGERAEVTVLEASDRLGGRVNTLLRDGFVIERGPDSFLGRKLPMIRLAEELGLTEELTGTNPAAKKTYIARNGVLHPMPQGLTLGIPADIDKFMETGLISDEGKRRALEEMDIPRSSDTSDESVGAFLERRFGREMVTGIFEPLLAGIHAGDLYRLGLQATFPQFKEMEQQYGSLIRGMTENRKTAQINSGAAVPAAGGTLPASVFLTFRGGLSTIVEALAQRLRSEGCDIRLGARVVSLAKASGIDGKQAVYRLELSDGSTLETDGVISTLPAYAAVDLLQPHMETAALTNIRYVSVANVVLGYDAADFGAELDGSGFLVPRSENRQITASTWTSAKWLHTAPEGKRLIRCYVGRAGDEQGVELPDEELTAAVRRDLQDLMGLSAAPVFVEITRLRHSMPQYPVGHVDAIAALRELLARRLPGVLATGAAFGGVGLPDCVEQGREAAAALIQSVR
ncbi:protoporphyrinogen oxidase [Cohnella kolymensis]|uniref:Coproporphyrinogen III oxidase n=1 Tax=Cohnella kolymensis TaxID=1590652 RepID=A0ABR5A9Q5_9BACL|nr:protoporphyrinogen oxidase [Cohnella kolymensis]KIL37712.1 protoporphyrinogen oxidase [Cohnella kolymensis]